jgi:hypothetical protein
MPEIKLRPPAVVLKPVLFVTAARGASRLLSSID